MKKRATLGMMLTVLTLGALTLAFNVQLVKAVGTIYIKSDGSVDGTDKIQRDGNIYTFTDNIYDSIVVERNNIVIDGSGYTLQGTGAYLSTGVVLSGRENVTIQNTQIKELYYGIWLNFSSSNSISGNTITNNGEGISVWDNSNNNSISGNTMTENGGCIRVDTGSRYNSMNRNIITANGGGIWLGRAAIYNNVSGNIITANGVSGILISRGDYNNINGNTITNNYRGVWVGESLSNNITENSIVDNVCGIDISWSNGNKIYHNNFENNAQQVDTHEYSIAPGGAAWDDGYPSGGNYWSDYSTRYPAAQELDDSGIWDTPYIIDEDNKDNYPLMEPWTPPIATATVDIYPDTLNLGGKGKWITAYIQLPGGYNAEDIDATTILLNDTISPVLDPKYGFVTNSSEYLVDHNNDGILERMVKFDRTAVESFIYNEGVRWGNVTLTITGKLPDGTPFEGTAVIFVNYAGDVNNDGKIDVLDAAAVSAHWYPGPPSGPSGYDANADVNKDGTVNILDGGIVNSNWGQTTP